MLTLSDRVALLQPTAVNRILAEVRDAQSQGIQTVSLMRGEPDFATPEHIVEAAIAALKNGRTAYPDNRGEPGLRAAVAAALFRDHGLRFDPESEILITTGATFGIHTALTAMLNPGDEVLLPDPIYDAYISPVRLAGGTVRPVAATLENGRFHLGIDALEAAWNPACKLLLLNTPWNPVGTVFSRSELDEIGGFCLRRNVTLISDEIYEPITYEGHRHITPAALSEDLRSRCILLNSLSKTYAMTGWRVGYCAAPSQVIAAMFLVLQQSSRGPATFIQDAAALALSGPQDCVREMKHAYTQRRSQVIEALHGLARVRVIAPEGGFFAMVDVREMGASSNEIRRRLLKEHGVVVMHGSAYGAGGEGTLRVSFASGGGNLAEGLRRLRDGLSQL